MSAQLVAYLVQVLLLVPSAAGGEPLKTELHREVISATSPAECERHAERLAAPRRLANAELLRNTRGRVVGTCTRLGAPA